MTFEHLTTLAKTISMIINKYDEIGAISYLDQIGCKFEKDKIKIWIKENIEKSKNTEFWQYIEEFNFLNRQLKFIKNNPSLNFLDKYEKNNYSIFNNLEIVKFLLALPFSQRLHLKYFIAFLKEYHPDIYQIRPERKVCVESKSLWCKILRVIRYFDVKIFKTNIFYRKPHKNISEWLNDNKDFQNFIISYFDLIPTNHPIFTWLDRSKLGDFFISANNDNEYNFIFRIITIINWLNLFGGEIKIS